MLILRHGWQPKSTKSTAKTLNLCRNCTRPALGADMRNEGEDREAVFANYATAYAVVRYTLDLPFAGVSIMAVTQGLGGLSRVRRVEKRRETVTRLAADITGGRFALSRSTLLSDMETAARASFDSGCDAGGEWLCTDANNGNRPDRTKWRVWISWRINWQTDDGFVP